MQAQGHLQVLLNILGGFTAQTALDAPRFCISPGNPDDEATEGLTRDSSSKVYFEEGFSYETINTLRGGPSFVFIGNMDRC